MKESAVFIVRIYVANVFYVANIFNVANVFKGLKHRVQQTHAVCDELAHCGFEPSWGAKFTVGSCSTK